MPSALRKLCINRDFRGALILSRKLTERYIRLYKPNCCYGNLEQLKVIIQYTFTEKHWNTDHKWAQGLRNHIDFSEIAYCAVGEEDWKKLHFQEIENTDCWVIDGKNIKIGKDKSIRCLVRNFVSQIDCLPDQPFSRIGNYR